MRTRSALIVLATLALAACTQGSTSSAGHAGSPRPAAAPAPGDLLFLNGPQALQAVDSRTGSVVFSVDGVVPALDWTGLYDSQIEGTHTIVRMLDPTTGSVSASTTVRGALAIRAVGADGVVALMSPIGEPGDAWVPQSRARTDITVADVSGGASSTKTFHLRGNFEPEAFSTDGERLYLLQYTPALNPTSYQVVSLYLEKAKVFPVYGPQKGASPVENMTATRLVQKPSPTGDDLYTLYSNQPPAYAKGFRPEQVSSHGEVAFIHDLSLANGFAACVALPKGFGSIPPSAAAIAVAPDGSRVYAIDAKHGQIAVMNTQRSRVVQTRHVELGRPGAQTFAGMSVDGGTLFVGTATGLYAFDALTLAPSGRMPSTAALSGLALSPDGARLYVSMGGMIEALDPASLTMIRDLPVAGPGRLEFVGLPAA